MRGYELLEKDCLRALLCTNQLFREQTLEYLSKGMERGRPWNSLVRHGDGQVGREAKGNAGDVRKWRAAVYYVKC